MATTKIDRNANVFTVINVFDCEPGNQDKLIAALEKATQDVFVRLPGFVSANLHKSLDGKHVVNYAQWTSEENFTKMQKTPMVQQHVKEVAALAKTIAIPAKVAAVFGRD
jgi:quinol monooxygenase YgiN